MTKTKTRKVAVKAAQTSNVAPPTPPVDGRIENLNKEIVSKNGVISILQEQIAELKDSESKKSEKLQNVQLKFDQLKLELNEVRKINVDQAKLIDQKNLEIAILNSRKWWHLLFSKKNT